jgi:subtilisin family serine protease
VRHLSRHLNLKEGTTNQTDLTDDDVVTVIVGYRNADGLSRLRQRLFLDGEAMSGTDFSSSWSVSSTKMTAPLSRPLSRISAVASAVRLADLQGLLGDPDVAYIDADPVVRGADTGGNGGDVVPFGMYQVQTGPGSAIRSQHRPRPPSSSGGPCLDAGALRVAVVDSGVDRQHPDLPCRLPHTCVGRDFTGGTGIGVSSSSSWDDPESSHGKGGEYRSRRQPICCMPPNRFLSPNAPGLLSSASFRSGTHVMGILGALSDNGLGIVGVVPDPTAVCWIIAKVLDGQDQGLMSQILEGTEWAAFEQNASVINLSIAGSVYLNSASDLFEQIRDAGILAVAAAGNDGGNSYSYPASYDSVVSV